MGFAHKQTKASEFGWHSSLFLDENGRARIAWFKDRVMWEMSERLDGSRRPGRGPLFAYSVGHTHLLGVPG